MGLEVPLVRTDLRCEDRQVAAEHAVTEELKRLEYRVIRRSDDKISYDLQAITKQGRSELYVEVKGTSGPDRRFYMTSKEHEFSVTDGWRLAMVTDALGNPDVMFFTYKQMERHFSLQPMAWVGHEVEGAR